MPSHPTLFILSEGPAKIARLWRTNLYGLARRIANGLDATIPFRKFEKNFIEGFEATYPNVPLPGRKTVRRLYEKAMWAKNERALNRAVQRIARTSQWRLHRKWQDQLFNAEIDVLKLLCFYDKRYVGREVQRQLQETRRHMSSLRSVLSEARRFDIRFDEWSKQRTWNEVLGMARLRMNARLRVDSPGLTESQRASAISIVCQLVKLDKDDSTDAVKRFLYRSQRRSKNAHRVA